MSKTIPLKAYPEPAETPTVSETSELPPLKISSRKCLPTGIATNVKQHVLVVRDCSSSMSGQKIEELNRASQALMLELQNPENKDGSRVSVIDFNSSADIRCVAQAPNPELLPVAIASGGTSFQAALSKSLEAIELHRMSPNQDGWNFLRPVVLLLSDGQSSADQVLIDELLEQSQVVTVAYGADADQAELCRLSSDGKTHVVGTDGSSLWQFLAEVGKTLSQALQNQQ